MCNSSSEMDLNANVVTNIDKQMDGKQDACMYIT